MRAAEGPPTRDDAATAAPIQPFVTASDRRPDAALLRGVGDLLSADRTRVLRALPGEPLEPRLVALCVAAEPTVRAAVLSLAAQRPVTSEHGIGARAF